MDIQSIAYLAGVAALAVLAYFLLVRRAGPPPLARNPDGSIGGLIATWAEAGGVGVIAVAISPDGKVALSGHEDWAAGGASFWDVATGTPLRTTDAHGGSVYCAAFSPDGALAITGSNQKTAKIWDVASRKTVATLAGHAGAVVFAAFSKNGRKVYTGSVDGTIKVWDATTWGNLATWDCGSHVYSIALHPSGEKILVGNPEGDLKLFEINSGRSLGIWKAHDGSILSVAFSSDGRSAVSGSGNERQNGTQTSGTMKLWAVPAGKNLASCPGHEGRVLSVAYSPDGRLALSGCSDKSIRLWDPETGKSLGAWMGHSNDVRSLAFSSDGGIVLSGSQDGTIKLWTV